MRRRQLLGVEICYACQVLLHRGGSATDDNLTPRPGDDTVAQPGRPPGLSTSTTAAAARKGEPGKVQEIDTKLLGPPLQALPDNPALGGTRGHYVLAPVDATGAVDQTRLDAWARCRKTKPPDPLVEGIRCAILREFKWP